MKKATSSEIYKVYNGSHLLLFGKKWQNFEISYENSSYYELSASVLNHFSAVLHFYTPWKRQKTFGFLTFSWGMEMWHWTKMG